MDVAHNTILNSIDNAIKTLEEFDDSSPENLENIDLLLRLRELNLNKDYLGIIELAVKRYQNKPIVVDPGQKLSLQDQLDSELVELGIAEYSILFDDDLPLRKYEDKEALNKRKRELEKILKTECKENIIELTIEALLEYEKASQIIDAKNQYNAILEKKFFKTREKRLVAGKNKGDKRKNRFKKNNECIEVCYENFAKRLNRPVLNTDYPSFARFLRKVYPSPPFIPEPRLTAKEKRQSKQIQREDRDLKVREDWSEPTLRAAFKKLSGKNPTSLKNNS